MRVAALAAIGATAMAVTALAAPAAAVGPPPPPPPQLTVVNALPGVVIDVYVDGVRVSDNLASGLSWDDALVADVAHSLVIAPSNSASAADALVAPFTTTMAVRESATLVAHLSAGGATTATLHEDNDGPVAEGYGLMTVQHAAHTGPIDLWVESQRYPLGVANGDAASVMLPVSASGSSVSFVPAGGGLGDALLTTNVLPVVDGYATIVQFWGASPTWNMTGRLRDIASAPVVFTDVAGNIFEDEIAWLVEREITTGWSNGDGTAQFRPLSPVNRDAMAAFLYRFAGEPSYTTPAESPFLDLTLSTQFYKEICWLYEEGISTGWLVPGGREYRPVEPIARDAMAAFLYRFAEEPDFTPPPVSPWVDVEPSQQFYAEMTWLYDEGISTGWPDWTFRPLTNIARDAMAAFLSRLDMLGL